MKKFILFCFFAFITTGILMSQSPEAFKYQAVVRDNTGELLTNSLVNFRMSIHQSSSNGTIIYQETFYDLPTNDYGLATLSIGQGTPTIGNFSTINWGLESKYLEVEFELAPEKGKGGKDFISMGTSQLMSVPFALYAKTVENAPTDSDWTVNGNEMYSTPSGNVGIGTNDPDAKLEVYKNAYIGGDGNIETYEVVGTLGWYNNDANSLNQFIGGISMQNTNGWWDGNIEKLDAALTFQTMENSIVNEKMRIIHNGNVGIGITNPIEKLEVNGNIAAISFIGDGSQLTGVSGSDNLGNHTATQNLNMANYGITNLLNPTNPQDAATKSYVDGLAGGDNDWGINGDNVYTGTGGIYPSGNVGIGTTNPTNAKLEISNATGVGIRVNSPGHNGLWMETPAINGIYVNTPGYHGFAVDAPGMSGYYVNNSTEDGIWIDNSGENGIWIDHSAYWGIQIENSTWSGMKINNSGTHGIDIYDSGGEGIQITGSALNGIRVAGADSDGINVTGDEDGVHAITGDSYNEWGVYTPDKIRADMGYSGTKMNGIGKFIGSGTLEKGDLVCIAGGYDENVLDRESLPVIYVEKANAANSEKIFGVVDYKVHIEEKLLEGQSGIEKNFKYENGNINNGNYLSIVVFGTTDVKVNSPEPIQAGQTLTAGNSGARKVQSTKVNGLQLAENVSILGKALESSNGKGNIKVFVNCK